MTPDDNSHNKVKQYRVKELVLGILLGFCAMGSSVLYVVFLRGTLGWPWVVVLVALEWLVMLFVFLIATRQMRRRK
ncbi:MAG TPA: hypothetical protein VK737_10915 [Opitutales bacterium]|jgi:hypothetical protein|nr:hypothetical protein [Opitutales bacterium]